MEDSILENSEGATYMSFILDVEIVIKEEDAHFNLAKSLLESKQTKTDEEINKNEKEESMFHETREEYSEQNNKEQIKDDKTHEMEAMESISFFDEFGLKRDKLLSRNSISNSVSFIFKQLKSSKNEKTKILSTDNNSGRITENQESVKGSVFIGGNETKNLPVRNMIFICNYLKASNMDDQSKNINAVSTNYGFNNNHRIDKNKTQDNLFLSAPFKEIVSYKSSNNLPSLPTHKLREKDISKIFPLQNTKSDFEIKFSLDDCNISEISRKRTDFSLKVNEDEQFNNTYEIFIVKGKNRIGKHKWEVPTFEIEQSFINNNDSVIKGSTKRHSYENLKNVCNLVNDNLDRKYFSLPDLLLVDYNFTRNKKYLVNNYCGICYFEPHFVSIKELTELKGILASDLEIEKKQNSQEIAPNVRNKNKKTKLQKIFVSPLALKKIQPLRFTTECKTTQLMTSHNNIKTFDRHSTNTGNPLILLESHQSNIAKNVQSKNSCPSPMKYVWKIFRRLFCLRPAKQNI